MSHTIFVSSGTGIDAKTHSLKKKQINGNGAASLQSQNKPFKNWMRNFGHVPKRAGVIGNSLLPYKFLRNSQVFIRQKGIPAHS